MSRWIRISLPLSVIFMCASIAVASDIYFAPTSAGSNNGTSCANAYAYNDGTHGWNQSAQEAPGNNLHVCPGTYNISAGGTILNTAKSGSAGSPITLVADQGTATFQSPYFSASGGIVVNNSYWVINGDNNLTLQNTLNGSSGATCPGGSCTNKQNSTAIQVNAGNVTIENMTISDIYVHKSGDSSGFYNFGIMFNNISNLTISQNTIHDARLALSGWGNNVTIAGNTMYNCAASYWGGGNVATSNVVIHDNTMYAVSNWQAGGTFHLEYIHLFTNYGGNTPVSGLQIYNNYFGSPGATCCQTAKLYTEGSYVGPEIFNNVFYNAKNGIDYMPSIEFETQTGGGGYTVSNPIVVNNTFIGGGNISGSTDFMYDSGVTGLVWQNNVVTGGATLNSFGSPGFASGAVNNNAYENIVSDTGSTQPFGYDGSILMGLSAWQAALPSGSGQDSASKFDPIASLLLNSDGTLQSGSPAIGLGANLTNLGVVALNSDKNGVSRPGSGAWDAGAYQFGGTGGAPSPPTGLAAVVN